MRTKHILFVILLFLCLLIVANAQDYPDVTGKIQELEDKFLGDIKTEKIVLMMITIVVISFGAVISFLQTLRNKIAKRISAVLGIFITISVSLQTTFFDADVKTYFHVYKRMKREIQQFENQYSGNLVFTKQVLNRYDSDLNALNKYCYKNMDLLHPGDRPFTVAQNLHVPGFLYASESTAEPIVPKWTESITDEIKGFIVASASDTSLDEATRLSKEKVKRMFHDSTTRIIQSKIPDSSNSMLLQASETIITRFKEYMDMELDRNIADSWFTYNPEDSTYTNFIRVYIDTRILHDIYMLAVKNIPDKQFTDDIWRELEALYTKPKRR